MTTETSERGPRGLFILYLKGIAMGAADVVPGVSGGTIAFIAGIYQELLDTIKGFNFSIFRSLKEDGLAATWKNRNATFIAVLLSGIFTSIISLAKGITYLLDTYPVLIWAFFFGLIVASSVIIARQIKEWNWKTIGMMAIGTAIAYYITIAAPSQIPDGLIYIFISGCIAICAMILPGISGSFILLLMGAYGTVLGSITGLVDALRAMDVPMITKFGINIGVFMLGCVVGIVSFSNVLSWMFRKAYSLTMALLTGFMVGSLNKVWPWKHVLEMRVNSHGEMVPFLDESILPNQYDGDPQLLAAIGLAVFGFLLIIVMEKVAASR